MKLLTVIAFGLVSLLLFPAPSWSQAAPATSGQSAPNAPVHYVFSAAFPTQFSSRDGDSFRAQGIAVDDGGQVYLTAKNEGIVQFDAQHKYRFSFGYPAPEDERDGVDQDGNPETGDDMPLSQRAFLRSADGQPFVVMPDAKTMPIMGHLFDPRPVAVNAGGQVMTIDTFTGWFQVFTGQGPVASFPIPTDGSGIQRFISFAQGKGPTVGDNSGPILFVLDATLKRVMVLDAHFKLLKTFGGQGSGPGQLSNPSCLAINATQTRLFVGDGSRVMVYGADGGFLYSFGSQGDKPGQFQNITALACSKAGHLFVLEGGRLQVFSEKGDWLGQVGERQASEGATGLAASFLYADSVVVDRSETVYLVDQFLVKIYKPMP